MEDKKVREFVKESNALERIFRDPSIEEILEFKRFLMLSIITIEEIEKFLLIYQPDAKLRDKFDMNVRIGKYYPPFGGPDIRIQLQRLLNSDLSAYDLHNEYEKLHPFMDGNGRSGRALWAWKMKDWDKSFLENYYFQTLQSLN